MIKEEKYYSRALIAIVAIVAIVGIVVMMLNAQPMLGTDISTGVSTEQESLLGAAARTACVDSDGGKNYGVKGTTTRGTNKVTDYCLSDNRRLVEYYCSNNKITSVSYDCGKVGKVCQNGACKSTPSYANETDTCIFGGSYNASNYCYSSMANCTGFASCNAFVWGLAGTKLVWSSNCLGNPTTTLDSVDENFYFNCTIY